MAHAPQQRTADLAETLAFRGSAAAQMLCMTCWLHLPKSKAAGQGTARALQADLQHHQQPPPTSLGLPQQPQQPQQHPHQPQHQQDRNRAVQSTLNAAAPNYTGYVQAQQQGTIFPWPVCYAFTPVRVGGPSNTSRCTTTNAATPLHHLQHARGNKLLPSKADVSMWLGVVGGSVLGNV
eukprot:1144196-Pelagomonas_calceolata.AAC.2